MSEVFIVSAKRTAIGGFGGALKNYTAVQLGAHVIKAAYADVGISPGLVDEVYFGNVLSAGLGQLPARQAALSAGLPFATDCTMVNKVCSSGLKAIAIGAQQITLGLSDMVIAGGMESMSNVPYYLSIRKQVKLGDENLTDGLLKDGLTDAYSNQHMGRAAELCSRNFHISREQQDEYAVQSYERAGAAIQAGKFSSEISPVYLQSSTGDIPFEKDEDVGKVKYDKIPELKPVFEKAAP